VFALREKKEEERKWIWDENEWEVRLFELRET